MNGKPCAELLMTEQRIHRRLAAILSADGPRAAPAQRRISPRDVVGYSRLMAADEAGTLAALKRHRESSRPRPAGKRRFPWPPTRSPIPSWLLGRL